MTNGLREKFAKILHSEYPFESRINPTSRDKLLRIATWNEISDNSKARYYKVADRLIRALNKLMGGE